MINIRNAKSEDMSYVMQVEEEAWPEEIRATEEKFQSRFNVFPKGFFLAELEDKGVVGVSTSEIINYSSEEPPLSWEEITDNGYIKKTHTPEGNALYVVSLGVSPRGSGQGVGSQLVEAQKNLVRELGLDYLVLGARAPQFHKYPELGIEAYLAKKNDKGEPLDPEIRFYSRLGLEVVKPVLNYMDEDPESRDYGVVMVWKNDRK